MAQIILPGPPSVEVTLRRSARARQMSLRVSRLDGRITMTLPNRVPEREGLAFLTSREDWVRRQLSYRPEDRRVEIGGTIPIEGQEVAILEATGRRVLLNADGLHVPKGGRATGARAQGFLKVLAREKLARASDHYAGLLGQKFGKITLRDTRSRWGSCSSQRDLMYSWRLIMAPPEILDYVAAHEACHLVEMNHSPDYWAVVTSVFPNYREARKWLNQHGQTLHQVRFTD